MFSYGNTEFTNANRRRNPECAGCVYLSGIWTCDYMLRTGRSRVFTENAHAGPRGGCSLKRLKGKPHNPQVLTRKVRKEIKTRRSTLNYSLAESLYTKGANDLQISVALNCSKKTVQNWRLKTGRPSNQPRGKNYRYTNTLKTEDTNHDDP